MALLELLCSHENLRDYARRFVSRRLARFGERTKLLHDQIADTVVLEIADG